MEEEEADVKLPVQPPLLVAHQEPPGEEENEENEKGTQNLLSFIKKPNIQMLELSNVQTFKVRYGM